MLKDIKQEDYEVEIIVCTYTRKLVTEEEPINALLVDINKGFKNVKEKRKEF